MRSFLTMLGIIIGVAAVIILVSIVNGYMSSMVESFEDMGVDRITVNVTNTTSRAVEVDEMYEFYDERPELFKYMTPNVTCMLRPKYEDEVLTSTSVGGYSEDYLSIMGYEMDTGRNISYADTVSFNKVAVIGYYTAWYIFGTPEEAVGQTIKMGGNAFKVIGVVERQDEDELEEGGTDDFVWIPYSVAAKLGRSARVSNFIFTCNDVEKADECTEQIENYLYSIFKSDDFYDVMANSSMLDEMNAMIAKIELMLGGIAGISLLVAGVGVMNIMLVSVTERTREIGIRKALGARRSVIMTQFVIEAAVTSTLGGIIGIIFGSVATTALGSILGFSTDPTFSAIAISFSVSVAIGMIFGYMPASRASKLNPIDALRSE